MSPAPQRTDPRRAQLRRQAMQRRQATIDRVVATRTLLIGGVVAASCILAGYLDASAQTRTSSSTNAFSGSGYTSGHGGSQRSDDDDDDSDSTQGLFGGGSAPSPSQGGGTVVSGGS